MKLMRDIAEMTLILAITITGLIAGFVDVGIPVNLGIMLVGVVGPIAACAISTRLVEIEKNL